MAERNPIVVALRHRVGIGRQDCANHITRHVLGEPICSRLTKLMNAVLFDIDGTLIQSADVDDELYRQSVTTVLGPVRFRDNLADYDLVTDSGILAQVLADNELTRIPDPTKIIQSHFVDLLKRHIAGHGPFAEVPGARDIVANLRISDNHHVAFATGGWRCSALLKLRSAGFETSGIPLSTSDDDRDRSKIMLHALAQLGTDFESITYYGDGPWDRDACDALGWNFIAVGSALNGIESFSATFVADR